VLATCHVVMNTYHLVLGTCHTLLATCGSYNVEICEPKMLWNVSINVQQCHSIVT
jgi:hypothetical protein